MKAWHAATLDVRPHHPLVLDSAEEGRLILINLPAGERLQEHRVHERAWLMVADGAIEITERDGETLGGRAGLICEFEPNEQREISAVEDSRIVLVLSPWPGSGHPSNG